MAEVVIAILCDADIVAARQKGREMAATCGFSGTQQAMLATAISEVARNILSYATKGEVELAIQHRGGKVGVSVIARDQGPGIVDIELAMRDGFSSSNSLGMGLPGARRIMDEFSLISEAGVGTTVMMTKWI